MCSAPCRRWLPVTEDVYHVLRCDACSVTPLSTWYTSSVTGNHLWHGPLDMRNVHLNHRNCHKYQSTSTCSLMNFDPFQVILTTTTYYHGYGKTGQTDQTGYGKTGYGYGKTGQTGQTCHITSTKYYWRSSSLGEFWVQVHVFLLVMLIFTLP